MIISSVRRKAFGRPAIVPGRSNTPPPGRAAVRFQGTIADVGGLFLQFDASKAFGRPVIVVITFQHSAKEGISQGPGRQAGKQAGRQQQQQQ